MSIGYGTKIPDDGWVKIFNHNIAGGYWSTSEALMFNTSDPDNYKYSQLHKLPSMKLNGEYVLKMVMDNYTNIWAQTHNPLELCDYASTVPGYRAIDVQTTANSWGGLTRGRSTGYLDCNPANTNCYYPLAPTGSWNGGLPQYDSTGHPTVELWVKIR